MSVELLINADRCYHMAEERAANYFKSLQVQLVEKTYVHNLTKDIQSWKNNHIHHSFFSFSRSKAKSDSHGYHNYIQYLDYTGKLDDYLA